MHLAVIFKHLLCLRQLRGPNVQENTSALVFPPSTLYGLPHCHNTALLSTIAIRVCLQYMNLYMFIAGSTYQKESLLFKIGGQWRSTMIKITASIQECTYLRCKNAHSKERTNHKEGRWITTNKGMVKLVECFPNSTKTTSIPNQGSREHHNPNAALLADKTSTPQSQVPQIALY